MKLAENLSSITKKLDEVNKSTEKSGKLIKKSEVVDRNTQTPATENTNISHSLLDTLAFMKTSITFFQINRRWW